MRTRLLWGGVAGPALFTITWIVEGALRPDYSAVTLWVSSLALTDRGWVQIVVFVVSGALITAFAGGLGSSYGEGRANAWPARLLGVSGLALIAAGAFPIDPGMGYPPGESRATWHGTVHQMVGPIYFLAASIAAFLYSRRFARSLLISCGVLTLAAWVAAGVLAGVYYSGWTAAPAGLAERIAIVASMVWMVSLAFHGLASDRRHSTASAVETGAG